MYRNNNQNNVKSQYPVSNPISIDNCNSEPLYLEDYSTAREREKRWDRYKKLNDVVTDIFISQNNRELQRQGLRLHNCSGYLKFCRNNEGKLKLIEARLCELRVCPICQWRKSMVWQAKFFKVLPKIREDYPTHKWTMLTLTVRNCEIKQLRSTIKEMQKGFKRLRELKIWPATGYVKSLEVTRGQDGTAHPHFHILMMVPNGYFSGQSYIKTAKWSKLWRDALRIDYDPVVDARAVKSKTKDKEDISSAVVEVLKYETKVSELEQYPEFLLELSKQMRNLRVIELGGVLKKYIRNLDNETAKEMIEIDDIDEATGEELFFRWQKEMQKYRRAKLPNQGGKK